MRAIVVGGGIAGLASAVALARHGWQVEDAVVLGSVMASEAGLGAYDRQRRPRTQMIARRSRRVGTAAKWAFPRAVFLRNTALRLLPPSSLARSLAPVLDWAA